MTKAFSSLPALGLVLMSLSPMSVARAAVQVIVGPTPIVGGDARSAGDITVLNEKLAFAIAVGSPVPYGVPRGAIIDVAPVKDAEPGRDRVVFADFIPNNWSAWPNTYQHVDILERGPERAVIRSVRDWGRVTVTTVYTLRSNSDQIEMQTQMKNDGDAALSDLLSGFTLWPNSGFVFQVPGFSGTERGKAEGALADRVVAYDADWAVTLHAPYLNYIEHASLDLYQLHTLQPHTSREFSGWLQVGSSGDLAPVVLNEMAREHLAGGKVHGRVTRPDGSAVEQAVVIVAKDNVPYAWTLATHGDYEVALPVGRYSLSATARNYSQSAGTELAIDAGADEVRNFADLKAPGRIHLTITDVRNGKPLDARLTISAGQKPLVGFLGRNTFFTDLDHKGGLDTDIAPGVYSFNVSSGAGFLGPSRDVELQVEPEKTQTASVALIRLFDPPARGWYSADLHHHADQAEAITPPAEVARSELAAGLDVLFVSDHDSTVNHERFAQIAASRGIPFVAGVELSPSWGHFNAYPLTYGQKLRIDTGTATVQQIFQEARRQGAMVVQVNHPFIPYGYFTSLKNGTAPGGLDPSFDLMEFNAQAPADDEKVAHELWQSWNAGHRYYMSAGSDTHDVWHDVSGQIRVFAHVDGKLTAAAFVRALRAGQGYVTHGPLIYPSPLFGALRRVKPGEPFQLAFDLESVSGLKRLQLIERGEMTRETSFPRGRRGGSQREHVAFSLTATHPTWYSVVVEDEQGKKAYSDPIWVEVARPE